jgi:hypothetical protein
MTGGRGHGWREQVLNEEVSYHEHSVQDEMIGNLLRQVAELIQRLAIQNIEMYCDIDGRNSKSNFKNPYYNPTLVREQRGRDEKFQHEEDIEDHS